jgi:four helix bundle protein
MNASPLKTFTDLEAWKVGHSIVLSVYKFTKSFPKDELYGLVSQMRRSAVSITSNLAEGFGRRSFKEKAHFYAIAQGSVTELQNQLIISHDIGYLAVEAHLTLESSMIRLHKLINGLIKVSASHP